MADMPNNFWAGWIAVITILSLVWLVWVVYSIYFPGKHGDPTTSDGAEPIWDKNLREGNNPSPMWWFWLIFAALMFSVIYLILYPGIGAYRGMLEWSQDSRLAESYDNYEDRFRANRAAIVQTSLVDLQGDTELMASAERIFTRNCAACHGEDARGQASLFPNLMDLDWQWGSSPEQIEQSIRNGRQALMPAWRDSLGVAAVGQVAEYVQALSAGGNESHPGQIQYEAFCVTCHGPDGTGNAALGAPDLTDSIWLYGGSLGGITQSIAGGRTGIMPAFAERLDDAQIKLLVAFLAR